MTRDPLIVRPKNVLGALIYDPEWIGQNAQRLADSIAKHERQHLPAKPPPNPRKA